MSHRIKRHNCDNKAEPHNTQQSRQKYWLLFLYFNKTRGYIHLRKIALQKHQMAHKPNPVQY